MLENRSETRSETPLYDLDNFMKLTHILVLGPVWWRILVHGIFAVNGRVANGAGSVIAYNKVA